MLARAPAAHFVGSHAEHRCQPILSARERRGVFDRLDIERPSHERMVRPLGAALVPTLTGLPAKAGQDGKRLSGRPYCGFCSTDCGGFPGSIFTSPSFCSAPIIWFSRLKSSTVASGVSTMRHTG